MDMKIPFKPDTQDMNPVEQWSEKYVDIESDIPRSKIHPLEWWYTLTAPPIPPSGGKLEERDAARRGRLNSTILLILLGMVLCLALPVVMLRRAKNARRPIPIQPMRSGTLLEPVIAELQGSTLFQAPDANSDSLQVTVSGDLQTAPAAPPSQRTEQQRATTSPPLPNDSRKHPHWRL